MKDSELFQSAYSGFKSPSSLEKGMGLLKNNEVSENRSGSGEFRSLASLNSFKYENLFDKKSTPKKKKSTFSPNYVNSSNKRKQRGKYKIFNLREKQEAVRIAKHQSIKFASQTLNVPEKNLKRWIENGPERKKGAGRKISDLAMEKKLVHWIKKYTIEHSDFPENNLIKKQALIFSSKKNFKASKGWCDKFFKRNYHMFKDLLNN